MTDAYDDAVVGAGILGLAHAYHLARQGRRVVVFERNARAVGASVRNFGMLWPIGQPAGVMRTLALRSREIWLEVLEAAGLWHDRSGSLHLSYRDDEAQVLREFADHASRDSQACELLSANEITQRYPAVRSDGLLAGLWSATETCVDPREVIADLPAWLERSFGVRFVFNAAVTHFERPTIMAAGRRWEAQRLVVCSGDDFQTLYPEVFAGAGFLRCKLQMMRSEPCPGGWRIGPMLAGGLTLRHYKAFEACPTLAALCARVARERPEFDRYGIHVMASQNGRGEIVIGDSHEYEADIEPFDKPKIDALILDYLNTFLNVPDLRIAQRWHGIYAKHPRDAYFIAQPAPGATIVTCVGGAGMTLSFGLAEKVVRESLTQHLRTVVGVNKETEKMNAEPKLPQLVVFDMAGTTVNDQDAVNRSVRDALAAAGLTVTAADVNEVMGIPKPDAIRHLISTSELRDRLSDRVVSIHADFVDRMVRFYTNDPSVYEIPGTGAAFRRLKSAGIRIAVDTGFSRPIAQVILDRLRWSADGLLDASITSDEVERGRPHRDMIDKLREDFGIEDSRRVAKVGDTPSDLEEGTNAGCGWIIGVTAGSHTAEQLKPFPHTHLVRSVADVPAIFGLD